MNSAPANRSDIEQLKNGRLVITRRKRYPTLTKGQAVLRHRYEETNTVKVVIWRILFWHIIKPL